MSLKNRIKLCCHSKSENLRICITLISTRSARYIDMKGKKEEKNKKLDNKLTNKE